jgi:hypothetical protein
LLQSLLAAAIRTIYKVALKRLLLIRRKPSQHVIVELFTHRMFHRFLYVVGLPNVLSDC